MNPKSIARFLGTRVLVVGDVILDARVNGTVSRVSPEAPVPVLEAQHTSFSLGGAANVAANVVSLGGTATLLGVVGDDEEGRTLMRLAEETRGLMAAWVIDPTRPTTLKTRMIAGGQQLLRLDRESRMEIAGEVQRRLEATLHNLVGQAEVVVISDYAKGMLTDTLIRAVIDVARERGLPTIVDPKRVFFGVYSGASLLTPNLTEAALAAGVAAGDPLGAGEWLVRDHPAVLITQGVDGMTLFRPDAAPFSVKALPRPVFDRTGAGDTVVATLAVALAAGLPLLDAVTGAAHASGIAVGKPGTSTVSHEELRLSLSAR